MWSHVPLTSISPNLPAYISHITSSPLNMEANIHRYITELTLTGVPMCDLSLLTGSPCTVDSNESTRSAVMPIRLW